jgi:hypothetical protein
MLTCYIRNDFKEWKKDVPVYCILLIPVLYVIYSIYAFISILTKRNVKTNKSFKMAVIKYLIYSALYIIFYFPTIILYLVSVDQTIFQKTFLSNFSYICSLGNITINLALCMYRIFEGYVKCDWKVFLFSDDLEVTGTSSSQSQAEYLIPRNSIMLDTNYQPPVRKRSRKASNRKGSEWGKIGQEMIKGV